jgi:hypothetical protein
MSLDNSTVLFQEEMSNLNEISKVHENNLRQIEKDINHQIETFKAKVKTIHSLFSEMRSLTSTSFTLSNAKISLIRTLTSEINPELQSFQEKITKLQTEIKENYETQNIIQSRKNFFVENPEVEKLKKHLKDLESDFQGLLTTQEENLSKQDSELSTRLRKVKNDYRITKYLNRLTSRKLSKEASVHIFTNREEFQSLMSSSHLKELTYQSELIKSSNNYKKSPTPEPFHHLSPPSNIFLSHFLYFLIGVSICLIFLKLCPFL